MLPASRLPPGRAPDRAPANRARARVPHTTPPAPAPPATTTPFAAAARTGKANGPLRLRIADSPACCANHACTRGRPLRGPSSDRLADPHHDCGRGFGVHCAPMKRETIAIHGGFDSDPTTKAVAVPIYQTAAYSFDSAEHGAALFNLEVEGYRYTRIGNPTTAVLEQRVAELEGGIDALSVARGRRRCTTRRSTSRRWVATSSPFRSSTAPPTPCSRTSCPGSACRSVSPSPIGRRDRGADRREHARDVLRDGRQSRRQYLRPRGARRRRAASRRCR